MSLKPKRDIPLWNGVCERCQWMMTTVEGVNTLFQWNDEVERRWNGMNRSFMELVAVSESGCACYKLIFSSLNRTSIKIMKDKIKSGDNSVGLEIWAILAQNEYSERAAISSKDYWNFDTTTAEIELHVHNQWWTPTIINYLSHLPEKGTTYRLIKCINANQSPWSFCWLHATIQGCGLHVTLPITKAFVHVTQHSKCLRWINTVLALNLAINVSRAIKTERRSLKQTFFRLKRPCSKDKNCKYIWTSWSVRKTVKLSNVSNLSWTP